MFITLVVDQMMSLDAADRLLSSLVALSEDTEPSFQEYQGQRADCPVSVIIERSEACQPVREQAIQ